MSLADKLASKLKYHNKSIESVSRRRTQLVRDSQLLSTGTFTGLILVLSLFLANNTYATSSSITITIDDNIVDLNVAPTANGAFSKSSASKIGVSTTNYTGYTLSISASGNNNSGNSSGNGNNNNNPTALINGDKSLSSIETAITEEQFKALDSTAYNNMWGYLPSKFCKTAKNNETGVNTTSCNSNTSFLPSPNTDGDILDITNTANNAINEYEITLGARVDTTASLGSYSNVFLVEAVANKIPYTITYLDNTISNMPTDVSDSTTDTAITISSNTPTRNGYTFIGWCTVKPTNNANGTDTCSGTSVGIGGTMDLDRTSSNNNFTLHAMWSGNYTIDGVSTMQEFSTMTADKKAKIITSMVEDQQYQLKDTRDNNIYWVAKLKDGNVWMTQGLDLDLSTSTTLTHADSDIGWSSGSTTKEWTPLRKTISFEGSVDTGVDDWHSDNDTPSSASSYYGSVNNDVYILSSDSTSNDNITNLTGCIGTGKTAVECSHYKVGNYYNFAAATATNSVAGTIGHAITGEDDRAIMPNSICPAGWRLPRGSLTVPVVGVASINNAEFDSLFYAYNITSYTGASSFVNAEYNTGGLNKIRTNPIYFIRAGYIYNTGRLSQIGERGQAWTGSLLDRGGGGNDAMYPEIRPNDIYPAYCASRYHAFQVRCLLR